MKSRQLKRYVFTYLTLSLSLGIVCAPMVYAKEVVNQETVQEQVKQEEIENAEEINQGERTEQLPQTGEVNEDEAIEVFSQIQGENRNTLLAFNTLVSCNVSETNKKNRYAINLTQSGRIELSVMAYMKYGRVRLYTSEGVQLASTGLSGGSSSSPKSQTNYYDLEPGTYYIDLERDTVDGQYQIMVGYTAVEINEQEPNNGTILAQNVPLDGSFIKGFISETDDEDVYKVEVPSAGRLSLDMVSSIETVFFRLGDANRSYMINKEIYYGSDNSPKYYSSEIDLEAGTYYIYIKKYSNKTGKYQFKLNFESANSDDIEPNNGTTIAQLLVLNGISKTGFISYSDKNDVYKIEVPIDDEIAINIKSMIGYIKFEITNEYDKNQLSTYIGTGSVDSPCYYNKTVTLLAGTYYLKIDKYTGTGVYQLDAYSPKIVASIRKEKLTAFATRMYRESLDREPDVGGLAYWVETLENNRISGYAMANFFVNSEEFLNKGLSNADYLDVMYRAFFGRTADEGGKAYWMERLANGEPRQTIFVGFAYSPEYMGICEDYGIPFM